MHFLKPESCHGANLSSLVLWESENWCDCIEALVCLLHHITYKDSEVFAEIGIHAIVIWSIYDVKESVPHVHWLTEAEWRLCVSVN